MPCQNATAAAVLTIALGIGATTAIFGVVHAVVLRPLPFADPHRIAYVTEFWRDQRSNVSVGNFVDWRAASQDVFSHLAAVNYINVNLADGSAPERVLAGQVSRGFFELFSMAPLHGRILLAEEDRPGRNTEWLVQDVRLRLFTWLGAVACVLLIACANVANLLLARGSSRARELAVRASLGASRWRIVRQLLAESLVLAAAGALGGVAIAGWATQLLAVSGPATLPRIFQTSVDGVVLAFAVALTVASAVVCGLVPALRAARTDLQSVMREGGRRPGACRARPHAHGAGRCRSGPGGDAHRRGRASAARRVASAARHVGL